MGQQGASTFALVEWCAAEQHPEPQDPQGMEVGSAVYGVAHRLFWGHEARGSRDDVGPGDVLVVVVVAHDTEVRQSASLVVARQRANRTGAFFSAQVRFP
jgi:hypothetical protein